MIISISKKEVFDEVEKRTSLEGSMLPERFESIWASPDDGVLLDGFWIEGYTAIIQLLKRYLSSSTVEYNLSQYNSDEILSISVDMPHRYNPSFDGSVVTDMKMLLVCNIVKGWLNVKSPDLSIKYEEESKDYSEDLKVKLLFRVDPKNEAKIDCSNDCLMYPQYEYLNRAKNDCVRLPMQGSDYHQRLGNNSESHRTRVCK